MGAGKRAFIASVGFLVAAFGFSTAAEADARACRRLEARLASLFDSSDGGLYERYDQAVAEQRDELALAKRRARGLGCGFVLGFGTAECQSLNVKIERMETNLADLRRKRGILATRGGGEADRERAMIRAQMAAEGCSGAGLPALAPDLAENEGGLFDRLGRSRAIDAGHGSDNLIRVPSSEDDYSVRAYRTMCVRTCDGYYFPMSPISSRNDFARDQQNCESICPGTEMRIYYQPSGLSDVATMMSAATEEPYPDLSTAYLYRRADVERPPACGCGRIADVQNYSIIAGEGSAAAERGTAPVTPHPWARPDRRADPETLANAEGRLDLRQIRELLKPKAAKLPPPSERKVRVVGPAFLPYPAEEEARPVQDPTAVR